MELRPQLLLYRIKETGNKFCANEVRNGVFTFNSKYLVVNLHPMSLECLISID